MLEKVVSNAVFLFVCGIFLQRCLMLDNKIGLKRVMYGKRMGRQNPYCILPYLISGILKQLHAVKETKYEVMYIHHLYYLKGNC